MREVVSFIKWLAALGLALIGFFLFTSPVQADSLVVNTNDDHNDDTCDSVHCSLREAIIAANENPGADWITFDLPEGINRLFIQTNLPTLTDNETTIEGPGVPFFSLTSIVLDGSRGIASYGLDIASQNNQIRFLSFVGFSDAGISIWGENNLIENNAFGLYPEGYTIPNGWAGVYINSINTTVRKNTVSGNNQYGIYIGGGRNLVIRENMIGTDWFGLNDLGNGADGIYVSNCHHVQIGSNGEDEGNVISGNGGAGVMIDRSSQDIFIRNNIIGSDAVGSTSIPNRLGIEIREAIDITIGGEEHNDINFIAGNSGPGIMVYTNGQVYIQGNMIGRAGLPNDIGIYLREAPQAYIGSTLAGNRIQNNLSDGILIEHGDRPTIIGNAIFMNGGHGIHVQYPRVGGDRIKITQNDIGYNGGKGIQFDHSTINGGIQPPRMLSLTTSLLVGRTCRSCEVEIFLSDLDSSGTGEGSEYLLSGSADDSGLFSIPLEGLSRCSTITTTTIDSQGNTSEFSENWVAGFCRIPPPFSWLLIFISLIMLGDLITHLWQRPGTPITLLTLILGGTSIILLLGGLLWLNFGNIPQEQAQPSSSNNYQPALSCISWLDRQKIIPPNGSLFSLEQPPELTWGLMEEISLPGDLRWSVEIINPQGDRDEQETSSNSLPLSAFNIPTDLEGMYYWRLLADWQNLKNNEWQPYCNDPFSSWFILEENQEAPEDQSTPPTLTPTPTEQAISGQQDSQEGTPIAVARINLNCRFGPNENHELIDGFRASETAPIEGQNANGSWLYIQPPRAVLNCWILSSGVDINVNLGSIPVIPASQIPTLPPTPTPTATVVPQTGCWVWNANLQKNLCVDPCPPNAQPGGSCTP